LKALAFVAVALAGCYSPETLDCTVACSAANECTDGQVCGSDGFCASPAAAGHCGGPDGGMVSSLVALSVTLQGPGKVTIDGVGVCDDHDPCTFSVRTGMALELRASPSNDDKEFVQWTGACSGSSTTCALTPVMGMTQVGAKFE
jgi:hypothetical protein